MNNITWMTRTENPSRFRMSASACPEAAAAAPAAVIDGGYRTAVVSGIELGHVDLDKGAFVGTSAWRPPIC